MKQCLFLVRHGETSFNRAKRYCGFTDIDLNRQGVKQAKRLRSKFRHTRINVVYTSPLRRTRQTARLAFGSRRLLQPIPALKELNFGQWEGLTHKEITAAYPKVSENWLKQPFKTKIPRGESIAYFKKRVLDFMRQLITDKNTCRNIAVVTHSGPIRVIVSELLGLGPSGYWYITPQLASASVLVFKQRQLVEYSAL